MQGLCAQLTMGVHLPSIYIYIYIYIIYIYIYMSQAWKRVWKRDVWMLADVQMNYGEFE